MSTYNRNLSEMEYIKKLEARIERLERAPRAPNTSIDTGSFEVKDPSTGNVIMRIGLQTHGDVGVSIYREDGSLALEVRKPLSPADDQALRLINKIGEVIGGDQVLTAGGVATHYHITPTKTSDTGVVVTSGAFIDIYDIDGPSISGAHFLYFDAICSDGSTSGEVRIVDELGNQLTGLLGATIPPEPVPLGTTTKTEFFISDGADVYHVVKPIGTMVRYKVQARRTAGAGTITIKALAYKQSPF